MATFEKAMKKMFKVGETYTGMITSYTPKMLVKFTYGGQGLVETIYNLQDGFHLGTEIEVMITGFNNSGTPLLVLTADCCNRLKIPVATQEGVIDAKSNSAILIRMLSNSNLVTYVPHVMAYEDERLELRDMVRFVDIEDEDTSIYSLLEKIVPVPKNLEIDTIVRDKAEKYASLLHRNGLHLGATYTGMATNNRGVIGKVLVEIIGGSVELLSDNVKFKIVNIPPKASRSIEAILIE